MPTEFESDHEDENDDGDDQQQSQSRSSQNDLRNLRKKAKDYDELAAKVALYERNETFRAAGIDPNDPKAKYFVKGYDGELSAEAIKAEAEAAGLLQTKEAQEQQQQVSAEEALRRKQQELSHSRMDGAGAGAAPQTPDAQADLIAKMESAKSMEELLQIATNAGLPTSLNR